MNDPNLQETIRQFRHYIRNRHRFLAWTLLGIGLISLGLQWLLRDQPLFSAFLIWVTFLGIISWVHILLQQKQLLSLLQTEDADALSNLEKQLESTVEKWQSGTMMRFVLGGMLVTVTLIAMIFFANHYWAPRIALLFVFYILACMIKGWLVFSDSIFLQDVRRIL